MSTETGADPVKNPRMDTVEYSPDDQLTDSAGMETLIIVLVVVGVVALGAGAWFMMKKRKEKNQAEGDY